MAFYVYITTNKRNGTLYIGHTDDIERRAHEHRFGIRKGFASKYNCTRLVWTGAFPTRDEALRRERQMKGWKRAWKIAAIERENPGWRDLGDDWHPLGQSHYRLSYRPVTPQPQNEAANSPPPQRRLGPMAARASTEAPSS